MSTTDTVEQHGYRQEYQYLHICRTCYGLYESGRPGEGDDACRRRHDAGRSGFDSHARARLCGCCGLEALPSLERWSMFFCRECQLLAMGVSVWERRLVFPIGPHSLMNAFVADSPPPTIAAHRGDAHALAATADRAIRTVVSGHDLLNRWYATVMASNLALLGLAGGVSLHDYLAAVVRERLGFLRTRLRTFGGLCELGKHRPEPVPPPDGHANRPREYDLEDSIPRLLRDPLVMRTLMRELGESAGEVIVELSHGDSSNCDVELGDLLHNEGRLYLRWSARGGEFNYYVDVRGLGGVYFVSASEHGKTGYFHSLLDAEKHVWDNWADGLTGAGRQFRAPFDEDEPAGWRSRSQPKRHTRSPARPRSTRAKRRRRS